MSESRLRVEEMVPKANIPATTLIDGRRLRVPDDLTLYPSHPKRVLIVGSCLSEGWARRMRVLPQPCESDTYLLGRDLPEQPEHQLGDYNFQIVQLALRFVLPDATFARLEQADIESHEKLFIHATNGMRRFLHSAMQWNRKHGILTFVFPFIVPMQNPMGRLLPRFDLCNPIYFIEKLNEELVRQLEEYTNVYFFDLNEIHSFYGRRYVQEDHYSALNHGSYLSNFDFDKDLDRLEPAAKVTDLFEDRVFEVFASAWLELIAMYRTVRQADAVKMVVIDLDDTLWRGTIAELDADSMPTTEGWPKGFWEALLFLKRRGILLAIISKNEESRVTELWDKLVSRQLKLDDFAIRRINWRPKPVNMSEILAHVNLLPGNVVYIDDNPAERAAMNGAFPDIRVVGGTPLTWRRILLWSSETQVPTITAESAARTDMVRAQVAREEQRATMSHEEFLASLNVTITILEVNSTDHPRFARALELINKTNQFNTTGQRWTREECVASFAAGATFHAFEVADLYTEYGLVGVLIVESSCIRQFVMSCRIMGMEAEVAAVSQIGSLLREAGASEIFAAMIETERNQPCRNLYSRCGFEAIDGGWKRPLNPWFDMPPHISLTSSTAR